MPSDKTPDEVEKLADALWDLTPGHDRPGRPRRLVSIEQLRTLARATAAIGARTAEGGWEYARRYFDESGAPRIRMTDDITTPDGHRADGAPYWNYEPLRRRKATRWEVVERYTTDEETTDWTVVLENQRQAAEKVIQDAPHERQCLASDWNDWNADRTCNCWKSLYPPKGEQP